MKISNAITDKLFFNRQAKEPPKEPAKVDTLKSLDTNKDGKLDRKEFSNSTLYQSADERQRDVLDRAYAAMANKSGEIDTAKSLHGLAQMLDENPKPTASLLESAYDAVKGFVGDLFSGMKKAASDFIDWATGQLEKVSNGFFDPFETDIVRKPEKTTASNARARLKETETDEQEALEKLAPPDREAYQAIATELNSDPVARMTLRNLLLDGRLPGDNDLAAGKSLLANLSTLATQPLADGIDRQDLLADVLAHVEDPITISQKQQNTCGPTTGQLILAKQEPAEYVRLAAGLATPEGSVTLQNGETIKRKPDWNDANDDERTVGNQLFQSALMEYANGKYDYDNVNDTRRVDLSLYAVDIPGMLPKEMANLVESLTGRDHDVNYSFMSDKVSPEFEAALAKAGPGSEVPIIVNYNVDGGGVSNTSPHYLLVTGYDAESGMVSISNPWGREEKVALDELQKHLIAAMPQA
jgi:hypothetical protein